MNDNEFQNQMLRELRDFQAGLQGMREEIKSLKQEVNRRFDRLERNEEEDVMGMLQTLHRKIDDMQEDQRSIAAIIGEHEVKIRTLSRQPV
ncbi:hypothetical protein GTO91_12915 [Heliobacterium undosum]|uniref:Uncharacterized protein n=1 Tax=Heliomicrobium undosum TaxID=121734 RepID=A0A845L6F1_9FIRM|nr:hypothetical protein [Heliomicrobium undosum]MZP30615.1 hypothetical protein [Heliomicrobium undosum]